MKKKTAKKAVKTSAKPQAMATRNDDVNATIPRANILVSLTDQQQLDEEQQQAYLNLLSKGASPAAACQQLAITLPLVAATLEGDESFRQLLDRVNQLLSQNVAAALYRSAMEGSVSAQTFYLKNKPPPEWPEHATSSTHDENELSDAELIAQIISGAELLKQITTNSPEELGHEESASVSPTAETAD